MNADLKRLRGNQEDGSPGPSKRRALGQTTSSDDNQDGMEDWVKVVEVSRCRPVLVRALREFQP